MHEQRPLAGIVVVSLEQAVAAPFCSCRLVDAGARVIKIERPEGDFARAYDSTALGQSSYFVWLNRGKESLTLDFKQPDDAALLHRIIDRADVYIENLAPGAAARAGLEPHEMRRRQPRLITCSISGYGSSGPYRERKAYDLLIQAETGIASVTGTPDAAGRVGVSIVDIATGANAYSAILLALLERERTGHGASISLSLFDTAAELMTVPLLQAEGGASPIRVGLHHPSIAPYGVFRAGDGEEILLSVQNEREWFAFCGSVLELPELLTDARFRSNDARVEHRRTLEAIILKCLSQYSRSEIVRRLTDARIAFGSMNSPLDLAEHPHLRRIAVQTDGGAVSLPISPIGAVRQNARVPRVGEHSAEIRQEFAIS